MNRKKILITAGRTFSGLDLARSFSAMGHEVYTTDSHFFQLCRFSNSVKKSFKTISPRKNPEKYIQQLLHIVQKYKIDFIVPVLEETIHISKYHSKFPRQVKVFCDPFPKLLNLHNKWYFTKLLERLDFSIPQTHLIDNLEEAEKVQLDFPFYAKASYSRASQGSWKINCLEDLKKIRVSPNNPLILQEFLEGSKYCSYSVCQQGKICAHSLYPVRTSIDGSSCLNFEAIDHPKIYKWIEKLVSKLEFTGQIAFDFIEDQEGRLYAIECNPRATSGIHLFKGKESFVEAFFSSIDSPILAKIGTSKKLGTGMLMYGWRKRSFKQFIKEFIRSKDVIFSKRDLKPFFFQPLLFFAILYHSLLAKQNFSSIFTYDFDYNEHQEEKICEEKKHTIHRKND